MASYDVVVVGGGIIGSAIAFRLAQEKLRVVLLERNDMAREASWAAAGMLSPAPDSLASIPLVPFGRASLSLYPDFIAEVQEIRPWKDTGKYVVVFQVPSSRGAQ